MAWFQNNFAEMFLWLSHILLACYDTQVSNIGPSWPSCYIFDSYASNKYPQHKFPSEKKKKEKLLPAYSYIKPGLEWINAHTMHPLPLLLLERVAVGIEQNTIIILFNYTLSICIVFHFKEGGIS